MFDKKSDYAQNKRKKDAIVYASSTGRILLTRADFASEEEFQKWKDWSDGDYQANEQAGRGYYDNTIPFNEKLDMIGAVLPVEEALFSRMEETENRWLSATLITQLMNRLTKKQYRRLWMYYVKNWSEREIAAIEHVGQQRVSKSIRSGKKIIEKFFK
jgi:DNA-directed RNA polymerase specialized sigma24 family protein